jgi:hypothetical protein
MFGTAAGHNVRMAIYTEAANFLPDVPLATTSTMPTANGKMEAAVGPQLLEAGRYYWIAAISDTDLGMKVDPGGAGYALSFNPSGWNTIPNPFPAGGSTSNTITPNFYVVLQDQ